MKIIINFFRKKPSNLLKSVRSIHPNLRSVMTWSIWPTSMMLLSSTTWRAATRPSSSTPVSMQSTDFKMIFITKIFPTLERNFWIQLTYLKALKPQITYTFQIFWKGHFKTLKILSTKLFHIVPCFKAWWLDGINQKA